jgi:hypothetical protein
MSRKTHPLFWVFLMLSVFLFGVDWLFSVLSGCVADLKSGLGDIPRGLYLSELGFYSFLGATASTTLAVTLKLDKSHPWVGRVALFAALFVVLFICLVFLRLVFDIFFFPPSSWMCESLGLMFLLRA